MRSSNCAFPPVWVASGVEVVVEPVAATGTTPKIRTAESSKPHMTAIIFLFIYLCLLIITIGRSLSQYNLFVN